MILPQTGNVALILAVLSLLFLGAWASMFKAAGKWRYELFYFDFAIGLMVAAIIASFTVGDMGFDGFSFLDDLQHAGKRQWMFCFLAGVIFNLGNMLLLGAVSVAGMSVAFPIAGGMAILLSIALSALAKSGGNPTLTMLGSILLFTAMVVAAMAYRIAALQRHEQLARSGATKTTRRPNPVKGIVVAVIGGLLMGSIGGLLARARESEIGLGPYSAAAVFALGAFVSTLVYNIFFMNLPLEGEPIDLGYFFRGTTGQHLKGIAGGAIWFAGFLSWLVVTSLPDTLQPNPLARVLLGQGAPIVAVLFGAVLWRELKTRDVRVKILAGMMVVLFACGLAMIGLSPLYASR